MILCLVIHAAATWFLVGLIWVIQAVHYPLMKCVGRENFIVYHQRHMTLITCVVGPLMIAEAASAGVLILLGEHSVLFLTGLAALALIWASTLFFQIPLHQKLTLEYSDSTVDRLVATNWWRTLGWTIRGLCVAVLLIEKL